MSKAVKTQQGSADEWTREYEGGSVHVSCPLPGTPGDCLGAKGGPCASGGVVFNGGGAAVLKPSDRTLDHGGLPCMPRPAVIKMGMQVSFTYYNRDESLCARCNGTQIKTGKKSLHQNATKALIRA